MVDSAEEYEAKTILIKGSETHSPTGHITLTVIDFIERGGTLTMTFDR